MGGRFAGEVSGVEFRKGGVEVLEVEHDGRRDTAVEVGLDEAEHVSEEPLLLLVKGDAGTSENKAVAASRDDLDRDVAPRSASTLMFSISASRPRRVPAPVTRRRSSLK